MMIGEELLGNRIKSSLLKIDSFLYAFVEEIFEEEDVF